MKEIKRAIVTGAGSGIGRAITEKLLHEGIQVIAVVRSGKIENLSHPHLKVLQGDISDESLIQGLADQIGDVATEIDYLINNAGIGPDLGDFTPTAEYMKSTFAVNTIGTVLFTEAVLKYLKSGSHVVFISSSMGLMRNLGTSGPAYCMSKAAINVYAVMLSQRLAERNICVTPLHPGWVKTKMGGKNAPVTVEQSANGIYKALTENKDTGRFWNVEKNGAEEF